VPARLQDIPVRIHAMLIPLPCTHACECACVRAPLCVHVCVSGLHMVGAQRYACFGQRNVEWRHSQRGRHAPGSRARVPRGQGMLPQGTQCSGRTAAAGPGSAPACRAEDARMQLMDFVGSNSNATVPGSAPASGTEDAPVQLMRVGCSSTVTEGPGSRSTG